MAETIFYIVGFLIVSFCFVVFFGAPYVPTLKHSLNDMFELYPIDSSDVLVDIGSGDGLILRAAAAGGARAIGYELNPWLYLISKVLCRTQRRVTIKLANFWRTPLPPDTTVVYAFLNGRYMEKLHHKLQRHVTTTHKPLYLISYGFNIPNQKIIKARGSMSLYKIEALQTQA